MIERGRILRSIESTCTLFAWVPGKGFATGDVRRCRNKYNGTVTWNEMFWTKSPTVPILVCKSVNRRLGETDGTYKLTALLLFPILILSITIKVQTPPNWPKPAILKSVNALWVESSTRAKNMTRTASCWSMNPMLVYVFNRSSLEPGKDEPSADTRAVMDSNVPLLLPSIKPPNAPASDRNGRRTNTTARNENRYHGTGV